MKYKALLYPYAKYNKCNLRVITVMSLGGPAPAIVCALTCNTYTVSGDNPLTIYTSTLLVVLATAVVLYWSEYCVITPVGVTGGLHCKVTELELTETASPNN